MTFDVNRDTEEGWDFLFVEARTAGGDDWTTLPDANGHTTQDTGPARSPRSMHPFLEHYQIDIIRRPTPDDDEVTCEPTGATGSGTRSAAERRLGDVVGRRSRTPPRRRARSRCRSRYASDISSRVAASFSTTSSSSTGEGSTSFEADGDQLDGWACPSPARPAARTTRTPGRLRPRCRPSRASGADALASLDRQPEIIASEDGWFGRYPFSASGGIVDDAPVFGFALETQTRPMYSPVFFFGGPDDFVVVHELAHQWYGDSLAVHAWQHIWLNEGFATYAEWLWSEREGFETAQEIFDNFYNDDPDRRSVLDGADRRPGSGRLFDFAVYSRGAMTLHALRVEVGDADFFRILRRWARHAGGRERHDPGVHPARRAGVRASSSTICSTSGCPPASPRDCPSHRRSRWAPSGGRRRRAGRIFRQRCSRWRSVSRGGRATRSRGR